MSNNVFPANPGPYRLSGSFPVYSDAKATQRASVFDTTGAPLPGNVITINSLGMVQTFQANSATVFMRGDDNNVIPLYSSHVLSAPVVTGSKGANAALTSLMAALVQMGIVTDSTS